MYLSSQNSPWNSKILRKIQNKLHFPAICRPNFLEFSRLCLQWDHPTEPLNKANSKETESLGKTAVEKSAWIKPWRIYLLKRKQSFILATLFY